MIIIIITIIIVNISNTNKIVIIYIYMENQNSKNSSGQHQNFRYFGKKENIGFRLKTSGIDFEPIANPYLTRT
jgi:hypothetical protein